jgi:hypothetical protein
MALKSSIGVISVTTTAKKLITTTGNEPIRYGIRLKVDSTSAKVYFGVSSVTASTGFLVNNSSDQIAPADFDVLGDVYLIADGTVNVFVDIVGQSGYTITS